MRRINRKGGRQLKDISLKVKHHIIIAATSHLNHVIQADPLHVLGDTIRTHVAGYQFDYIPHPVLTMYYIIGSVTHSPGAGCLLDTLIIPRTTNTTMSLRRVGDRCLANLKDT